MIETIGRDMLVAIEALKREDFGLVNIIGNRIATDSMIIKRNDLIIIGFLIKEVSGEIGRVKEINEKNLTRCKEAGRELLEGLRSLLGDKIENKEIWEKYQNYEREIRKYLISDIESSIYKENQDFTKETRIMLLEHLNKNRKLLIKRDNRLINGVAFEISRVINSHGFYPEDLVFYLVMKVLDSYYDYFFHDFQLEEDEKEKEKKEKEINSYIDNIYKLFSMKNNIDNIYEESTKIVGEFGVKWREYFINFGEIRMIKVERGIELTPEAKKKIEEGIGEVFERKVKEGK